MWLNRIDIVMRRVWENTKTNLPKNAAIPERRTLSDEVWNDTITTIEMSVRYSCYDAFVK